MRPPRRPRERVLRQLDWTFPPPPVRRELLEARPDQPQPARPPLLFVHGAWHAAWSWQESWLPAVAAHGWHGFAVSLRGHGQSQRPDRYALTTLRHYEHDVLQTITRLPAPPVLIGHSMGGLVVQGVLERYRAAPAAVLVASAPPRHGLAFAAAMLRHDPALLGQALVGADPRPRPRTFFGSASFPGSGHGASDGGPSGAADPEQQARRYVERFGPEAWLASVQVALPRRVADVRAPVLVLGGADDHLLPAREVVRTARTYGTTARLFRGMGHDLMLGPGNLDVLAVVLDWLDQRVVSRPSRSRS
jgi:pimeloyl-ACP methyl ester carboxylesterase